VALSCAILFSFGFLVQDCSIVPSSQDSGCGPFPPRGKLESVGIDMSALHQESATSGKTDDRMLARFWVLIR
jgi:hypothetical protein